YFARMTTLPSERSSSMSCSKRASTLPPFSWMRYAVNDLLISCSHGETRERIFAQSAQHELLDENPARVDAFGFRFDNAVDHPSRTAFHQGEVHHATRNQGAAVRAAHQQQHGFEAVVLLRGNDDAERVVLQPDQAGKRVNADAADELFHQAAIKVGADALVQAGQRHRRRERTLV